MSSSLFYPGRRLSYAGVLCTVRYFGPVGNTLGEWVGIEWDDSSRGRHAGEHDGQKIFDCLSSQPTPASFVRPVRPFDQPLSFLEALHQKYADDSVTHDGHESMLGEPIKISGKTVEEVGFDKIRDLLATLHELRIVLLDGLCIAGIGAQPWPEFDGDEDGGLTPHHDSYNDQHQDIWTTCPNIVELDLSRNLLERWIDLILICQKLPHLQSLKLNGNRFRDLSVYDWSVDILECLERITELSLDDNLMSWDQVVTLTAPFGNLTALSLSSNAYTSLTIPLPTTVLTTLNLSSNNFTHLSALAPLTSLPALTVLSLRSNQISTLTSSTETVPVFSTLLILDLSINSIPTFGFISHLPFLFPVLISLRVSQNPVFDALAQEESYILTLARIATLQILNYSKIAPEERLNAELYYLSRIGKDISAAPAEAEQDTLAEHPRYAELCSEHGPPDIVRAAAVGENTGVKEGTLAARLIHFTFYLSPSQPAPPASIIMKSSSSSSPSLPTVSTVSSPPPLTDPAITALPSAPETGERRRPQTQTLTHKVPRTVTPYRLKSIVGKLFGLKPMHLRLVWETGEWDPSGETLGPEDAGYWDVEADVDDDGDGDADADVDAEPGRSSVGGNDHEQQGRDEGNGVGVRSMGRGEEGEGKGDGDGNGGKHEGRWVRREVELLDGTREVGFWIEGREARVRVEWRENTW